jgi:hypothetical protein
MDDRIRQVYERLYIEISSVGRDRAGRFVAYPVEPLRGIVDGAAEEASIRFNKELRPDAKMLLLLNFGNLVVVPLAVAERAKPDEIYGAVAHDIATLVAHAAEIADGREISAHTIIDALSGLWRQLDVSAFKLWE